MHSATRPPLVLAAVASAAAGLIHAAAAGSHAELGVLATLFGIAAVLQIGWAAALLRRDDPPVVLAGVAVQLAAIGVWLATRTVGIGSIEGLGSGQAIGFQDGLTVGLEAVAVAAALASLARVGTARWAGRLVPVLAAGMVLAAVPAMATPHDHDDHDHDEVATGGEAASAHDHDDADDHDDGHDHDEPGADAGSATSDGGADDPPAEDLPYPASFVDWLDTAATPAARDRAEQLIVDTTEAMAAFPDEAAVQAAGYVSIGDGATGWEHYVHVGHIIDPAILDPDTIESIVLKVNPDGTKEVASAMYLLPFGTTMDDVPDIAGDLTTWHDHQNLCWDGVRVVGTTGADGRCARGEFRPTQPMLHVWTMEHECGPFAGIEGSHGSGCAHAHDEAAAPDDDHTDPEGSPDHDH